MQLTELLSKIKDELKLRNYSRKTIQSYLICLSDYFKYIKIVKKDPGKTNSRVIFANNQSLGH